MKASVMGVIKTETADLARRLASAITWEPSNGRPSGLYWANDDAFEAVGIARSTWYKGHAESLKETGFLVLSGGNLLPAIPESHNETSERYQEHLDGIKARREAKAEAKKKSRNETSKSQNETPESHGETAKSQNEPPYTVDKYTVDSFSVDTVTEEVAAAPSLQSDDSGTSSLCSEILDVLVESAELRKSQNETFEDDEEIEWDTVPVDDTRNRGSVRTTVRARATKEHWTRTKEKGVLDTCLARLEMHAGTVQSLVDEVIAEWEVGVEDW